VESKHGNSKPVADGRVYLAVTVIVGNHLAATLEVDRRAVVAAIVLLELHAVSAARRIVMDPAHEPRSGLANSAADFDVIPPGEIELAVVEPPRHVDVHATGAVFIVSRVILHRRDVAGNSGASRICDILADRSARVCEALRMFCALRVEEQARGLQRARGQHDDAGFRLPVSHRRLVDV
jgi:hypothetical protein